MSTPAERVWAQLPPEARSTLEQDLSPTDLQTLLLDLARTRSSSVTPARLAERWRTDGFVSPAAVDPRRLAEVTARLWRNLPADVDGVVLSPVTPLGTCSAVGATDQNRVLSTVRTSEVVSDPTNVLALEAARRRSATTEPVHLAAVHRVLRNQRFPAPALSHFELFALTSSARDAGSATTEIAVLQRHWRFWAVALDTILGPDRWVLRYTMINHDQLRHDQLRSGLSDLVAELGSRAQEDPDRTQAIGYYRSLAFKIMIKHPDGELEIGDGGFTDWTAQLRADAKERCLISCVSTERLAAATASAASAAE